MANRETEGSKLFIGYYVVAFVDLLGQQQVLRDLMALPGQDDPAEKERFRNTLKNTYGTVMGMRKSLTDFFSAYSQRATDISGLDDNKRKLLSDLTGNPIKTQPFSDSVVVYSSLRSDTAKLPIRGVFGIIAATASTFLVSLATGHPVRGGIDIGLGTEISPTEFYGPALSRAYALESRVANYPRIVVGGRLIEYLQVAARQAETDVYSAAAVRVARMCLEALAVDDDGRYFVDFLGKAFREWSPRDLGTDVIRLAHETVIKASEKCKLDQDSKLAFRYTLLRNYFESRLLLWADPASGGKQR